MTNEQTPAQIRREDLFQRVGLPPGSTALALFYRLAAISSEFGGKPSALVDNFSSADIRDVCRELLDDPKLDEDAKAEIRGWNFHQ